MNLNQFIKVLIMSALTACISRTANANNQHDVTMKAATNSLLEIQNFIKDNPAKIELFWSQVNKNGRVAKPHLSPCWEWTGKIGYSGYGFISNGRNGLRCHRLSFVMHGGILTDKKGHVLHACDNPACVNPEHLREGDQRENNNDKMAAGRQSKGDKHAQAIAQNQSRGEKHSKLMLEVAQKGEDHHNSILTESAVREIRDRYAKGGVFYKTLAKEYNVSRVTIGEVVRKVIWKHVI